LNIKEFTNTITNIANIAERKQLTDEDIKKIVNDNLERIEKELDKVKDKVKGQLVGVKVFFMDDLESGLLYGNFIVEGGVPKIKTWIGTAKNNLVTDLVDTSKFSEVAEEVFSKLVKDGRVVPIGPRGIGKSTLATYVAWRSLLGSLGSVILDKPMDAVIHIEESLRPGDAAKLNNLVEATGRRFIVICDPSPIEAYYKPETMQVVKHDIESVKNTLRELMEVRNAWVVIILPRELYDEVSKSEELRNILDEIRSYIIDVDLKNEGFLREVIKKYSGCDDVSDDLVKGVMGFDSYTLVAKYTGIWIRERGCGVEDVDKALRESAGQPKLFFANYIWGTILGKSMNLARRVSVPLILHATLGPIPEGFTYITKAVNEGGVWKLIDRDRLAKSKLEDLKEADLEPIAKWLSTFHEDLIEETLEELVGLRGEEARKHYIDHGFKDFIKALDWGYKEALGEGSEILGLWFGEIAPRESSMEEFMKNLVKKLEQLIKNEDELKEVVKPNQMFLVIMYQQLLAGMKALPEETKAEFNSLLNLRMNLSVLVFTRSMIVLKPLTNCWKRAALIIGYALTGHPIVPRPEDLPESLRRDVAESLGDALRECDVDYYLLVGNKIQPLIIMGLVIMGLAYTLALAWAFIDKYNEAIDEVNRILNIAGGRGSIYEAESFYDLGLASIIANAARLGRDVKPGDADTALHIASFTIQRVASSDLIKSVLGALEPLYGKAPHRYLELLAAASVMVNLDLITVRYIFDKLNEILDNYGGMVKEHAWFLVDAIIAYANLLKKHLTYFSDEVKGAVNRVADLLNELDRFRSSLSVIAWAHALAPALRHDYVRGLMEEKLGIDVVGKASEVLEELNDMRERFQELMRDEKFRSYIESKFVKADEKAVKKEILKAASLLKHVLASYRLDNNELVEARDLFNEAAEERREIGDYENYLTALGFALRVETIKGSLVGEKLVNEFRQLYEETFNVEHFELTAEYLSTASVTFGEYIVSLALMGDHETINKLLEKHLWVLNANKQVSVLTRLMLNALLSPRDRLSSELKGKLSVNPEELIDAFGYDMLRKCLPALRVAFKMIRPEDGYEECMSIEDSTERRGCEGAVLVAADDSDAVGLLRGELINYFHKQILEIERSGWLRELGFDANALISEFKKLVYGLDGKSVAQLFAIYSSTARLALMLHALINGNKDLAKALALDGAVSFAGKLLGRLFLEAFKECYDLGSEGFRLAIARLFFYHI